MFALGLAALAASVLLAASSRASAEVGVAWQDRLQARNKRQARKDARAASRGRVKAAPRVRSEVDCCAAGDDNWRSARAIYDRWVSPTPMSYREALAACWAESHAAAEAGDYSKPATRRCALGKMHAAKLSAWQNCRAGCGGSVVTVDPFGEASEVSAAEFFVMPDDDGSGGRVWLREGSPDRARVVPSRDGWIVQLGAGEGWRLVELFEDEPSADDAARALLDAPF